MSGSAVAGGSPSTASSVIAVLRLASLRMGCEAIVLAAERWGSGWQLVASTSHVSNDDLDRMTRDLVDLGDGPVPIDDGGAVAYPVRGARQLLGFLVLRSATIGVASDPEADVLQDVLHCLADLLHAAEARTDAESGEQSSRAVRRLFVEGAHAQDVREAGAVLARVAADTFQTERAGMYVIDGGGTICFAIGVGVPEELSDALAASLNGKVAAESPVWQMLEQLGGPHLVDDSRLAQIRPGGFVETMAFRSYVAIPLLSTDGPLGMVICGDSSRSRSWDTRDRDLANQFALEAALIVDAARLRASQRAQLALLSHQAHHDGLTGLANRRLLMDQLDKALRVTQAGESTLAMLLLDLNDFKRVNDTLGHRFGDDLLREVGTRLHRTLRSTDTLARLGGDEFAMVLSGGDAHQAAQATTERIEAALAEPVFLDGIPVIAAVSIGIAVYPDHANCAADLLQHADVAMYAAKRSRNGAVTYDRSMDDATADRLALYSELRKAINNDELRLVYQPKVDLHRGVVLGVESLLRWQHPRRGLLSPADFLPFAESSELIHPLTAWVTRTSLAQQQAWIKDGLDLHVAVNMSARNFMNADLLAQIEGLVLANGSPGKLIFEVTETSVMTNPSQSILALNRLRTLGARISIDDFGTGHSSLALLGQLPVDELKIDRALVQAAESAAHDRALVDTIIHLGHRLGLSVVAEGIETTKMLHVLQDLNCDVGQGYLFSPPVEPANIPDLMRERGFAPVAGSG